MELRPICCLLFVMLCISSSTRAQEVVPIETQLNANSLEITKHVKSYIENTLQLTFGLNLEAIKASNEIDIAKDIAEIIEKNRLELSIDTKQLINKMKLISFEKQYVAATEEQKIKLEDLINKTDILEAEINKLKANGGSSNGGSNTGGSGSCNSLNVPITVKPGTKVWGDRDTPVLDDVDTYWNNTIGCQYKLFNLRQGYFYTEERFEGNPIQKNFALRSPGALRVTVWWRPFKPAEYWIDVGATGNTQTKLIDNLNAANNLLETVNTPNILSGDKYTEFYLRIDKDNLTFGKKCENPIITRKIQISGEYMNDDIVYVKIEPKSVFGGKVMHHCRA